MVTRLYALLNYNLGEWIGSGARGPSDLAEACGKVAGGSTLAEVAKDHPSAFVRNYKGLAVLRGLLNPVSGEWSGEKCVFWLWGTTGSGKSRAAFGYSQSYYEPIRAGNGVIWWDGYCGEETIIFDDIRPGELRVQDFLRWTDGRDGVRQVKGGTVGVKAHTWIFTSNHPVEEFYSGSELPPVLRRITTRMHVCMGANIVLRCGHGHTVEPGNTMPVQRDEGGDIGSSPPNVPSTPQAPRAYSPASQSSLVDLLECVEEDFCKKHGLPLCSARLYHRQRTRPCPKP